MTKIADPEKIDGALFEYHLSLSKNIFDKLKNKPHKKIIELGSGLGTFTLPFIEVLKNDFESYHCVDPYLGPYNNDRQILENKLGKVEIKGKVEIIECDAREIDKLFSDIDLIIGHEILCDLNSKQVSQVLRTCFEVLKPGGNLVHAEFSPIAVSRAEELLHIFDDFSSETVSNTNWFSPTADELAALAKKNGFSSISVDYIKIPLHFNEQAAIEMVNKMRIGKKFIEQYQNKIQNIGFEYPMEQIIYCTK